VRESRRPAVGEAVVIGHVAQNGAVGAEAEEEGHVRARDGRRVEVTRRRVGSGGNDAVEGRRAPRELPEVGQIDRLRRANDRLRLTAEEEGFSIEDRQRVTVARQEGDLRRRQQLPGARPGAGAAHQGERQRGQDQAADHQRPARRTRSVHWPPSGLRPWRSKPAAEPGREAAARPGGCQSKGRPGVCCFPNGGSISSVATARPGGSPASPPLRAPPRASPLRAARRGSVAPECPQERPELEEERSLIRPTVLHRSHTQAGQRLGLARIQPERQHPRRRFTGRANLLIFDGRCQRSVSCRCGGRALVRRKPAARARRKRAHGFSFGQERRGTFRNGQLPARPGRSLTEMIGDPA
jgi:hypothetical protein